MRGRPIRKVQQALLSQPKTYICSISINLFQQPDERGSESMRRVDMRVSEQKYIPLPAVIFHSSRRLAAKQIMCIEIGLPERFESVNITQNYEVFL